MRVNNGGNPEGYPLLVGTGRLPGGSGSVEWGPMGLTYDPLTQRLYVLFHYFYDWEGPEKGPGIFVYKVS